MTPIEFLRAVWPDDGFYCIAIKMPNGAWWHTVYPTITEAAEFAEKQKDRDVYFCVHSLSEERVWNPRKRDPKTGEMGAYSIRTQANMREARAFFFDLDVGDGDGKYPSIGLAADELMRFCDETLLPQPMIVRSGGGLHVYWLLEDAIQTHQWRAYAARLRALAEAHDLIVDPARTTDVASILRVAGTFNHKTGTPRPVAKALDGDVTPTEDFIVLLNNACREAGVNAEAVKAAAPSTTMPLPDHLKGYVGNIAEKPAREFYSPPAPALFKGCAQADWALSTAGNVSYAVWRCWLSIFNCVIDGDQLCYEWSSGGDTFDEASFELAMAGLNGPYGCAQVADKCGSERCEGCPLNGKGKNPLDAARPYDTAPPPEVEVEVGDETILVQIPDPPTPYQRQAEGGVGRFDIKTQEVEPIYHYDLFPTAFIKNEGREESLSQWRQIDSRGDITDFVVPMPVLYSKEKFSAELSNRGVIPDFVKVQKVQAYMVAYIQHLQRLAEAEAQHNHLGWSKERDRFVLPDRVLFADGTVKPVHLSQNAARTSSFVDKAGTLEKQIELLDFYNHKDYLPNQFMILASLAAPILHMTGHHGAIVNASGDAGCSKSTTLYTGASFWGHPDRYPINGTNSGATMMARNNYIETLANLPICVDEITHIPLHDAKDLAMNISQANGRVRSQRDGTQRATSEASKSTIMLTTANSSLHALLSTDNSAGTAGSMRVIEIAFKRTHVHSKQEADLYINQLLKNFGHIGPIFIDYVVRHQAEIEARILETRAHLDSLAKIAPAERFWSAVCAAILIAGEIANKLGLLRFNMMLLKNWIINVQIPSMRGVVETQYTTPLGVLTEFLEQINSQILVTKPSRNDTDLGDTIVRDVTGMLSARYDIEHRTMWVLKKAFRDYCVKIGSNPVTVLNELSQTINGAAIVTATTTFKMLGHRTRHAKAQTPCFAINMDHPEISGFLRARPVETPSETHVLERPDQKAAVKKGGKSTLPPINPFD